MDPLDPAEKARLLALDTSDRAVDLESEREGRATKLAYEKGQSDAKAAARFTEIDRRLDAVNGSIADTASELHSLGGQFRRLETQQLKRDAISEALEKAVREQNTQQISTRQFWIGVGMLIVAIVGVYVASL